MASMIASNSPGSTTRISRRMPMLASGVPALKASGADGACASAMLGSCGYGCLPAARSWQLTCRPASIGAGARLRCQLTGRQVGSAGRGEARCGTTMDQAMRDAAGAASQPAAARQPRVPDGETAHPRGDTRERIQAVALELFAEQGYEKTSLREIAERLGVTKAALYYHFKSKEDIVSSLVEDYFGQIDALIEWGRNQPRTAEVRGAVLNRYFGIVEDGSEVFRMMQQNQAALSALAAAKHRSELFRERMDGLVGILSEPGAPLAGQVRAAVALASVSFGCMFFADRVRDPAELREVVLGIAFELAAAQAPAEAPARAAVQPVS